MLDNRFSCFPSDKNQAKSEMVSIEANRILDSCRDKDCFEDVKILLTDFGNEILEHTTNIRAKSACITWTYIGIDPVRFNRGFYTVTIKFYVKITFEACLCGGRSQEFDGVAVLEKKVILYGGESSVNVFKSSSDSSDFCAVPEPCCPTRNVPTAIVEVVDPVILSTKVKEAGEHCCCCCCCNDIPESICSSVSGTLADSNGRYLAVSFGIFSIIRIVRSAQYIINATEYCVPDKECISTEEDDPCAIFRHMAFPTQEFCPQEFTPPKGGDHGPKCGCGN